MYEVSSLGRVKSCRHNKILKPNIDRGGYARVPLYRGDGTKLYNQIHRLVAKAFIPNESNLPCINHINSVRSDNRLENLEWCNHSYNNKYAYEKGNRIKKFGKDNCKSKSIIQFDLNGNMLKEFESMCICARELNLQHSCISMVCNGIRKTTGGYVFRKKEDIKC